MQNKFIAIGVTWVIIIAVYIIIAFMMPAFNSIVSTAGSSLEASANMSNFPGTQETVASAPVWIWFIPGLVGIVYTVWKLKKG